MHGSGAGERDVGQVGPRVQPRRGGRGEGDRPAEGDGCELLVEAPDLDPADRRATADVVGRVEGPPDRVRPRVGDDRVGREIVDPDRAVVRPRMRAWQHGDAGLGEQVLERVTAIDRPPHERDVGGAGRKTGRRIVVVGQPQADLELRLGRLQMGQDRRRELRGGEHRVADAQRRGAGGAASVLDRARGLRQNRARGGEQGLAGRRQPAGPACRARGARRRAAAPAGRSPRSAIAA